MRFFVYEFVSGGGWWSVDPRCGPSGSLLNEGAAMLRAVVNDFSCLGSVCTLRDSRCEIDLAAKVTDIVQSVHQERQLFQEHARNSDWTIVIAPEFDGHLLERCNWVQQSGGRLLCPGGDFVAIASNKDWTARVLEQSGVRVPRGQLIIHPCGSLETKMFPAILKPVDGAGSLDVRLIQNPDQLTALVRPNCQYRLEEFCPGVASSVSILSGPARCLVMPASRQILSDDHEFRYLGGEVPLPPTWCARAERLARKVIAALPASVGYWGIDLILGLAPDGSQDVVVEVNPRVTTSYLGLRQIAAGNLAEAILRIASGEPHELSFDLQPVQFAADDLRITAETFRQPSL